MAILSIHVPKADASIDIETDTIPDFAYRIIFMAGLRKFINAGMGKLPDLKSLRGVVRKRAEMSAMEKAEANYGRLMSLTDHPQRLHKVSQSKLAE